MADHTGAITPTSLTRRYHWGESRRSREAALGNSPRQGNVGDSEPRQRFIQNLWL